MMNKFLEFFVGSGGSPLMIGSIQFALIFTVFLLLYVFLKRFTRTGMMLYVIAFNLFFAYRANALMMVLLPLTAVLNWFLTQWMRRTSGGGRRALLAITIFVDVGALCWFKYTNFIIGDVLNEIFATNFSLLSIALPIGISFYTFQAISYAVDVYKGTFTDKVNLLEYLFYLTFFPLLLAGPITRAKDLIPQLKANRQATEKMVWTGLWLIMLGLIKKNVISDYISQYNNWVFDAPSTFSGFEDLMAILAYPVQIFLDFSGYSDMSIGVASIMGFNLPDNFSFPYRALNLTDFWRRWHISLSSWFRDYVYIPLGGNRKGKVRMYLNNFLTMLLAGLWHGASWMFVIWGALHGAGLVIHKFFSRQLGLSVPRWANFFSWLMTYLYVTFAWTFFRARDLGIWKQLFDHIRTDFSIDYLLPFCQARTLWVVLLAVTMLSYLVSRERYQKIVDSYVRLPWIIKALLLVMCIQLVLEFSISSVQPFIYTQF